MPLGQSHSQGSLVHNEELTLGFMGQLWCEEWSPAPHLAPLYLSRLRIISLLSLQRRLLLYSLYRMGILWTDFELQERPMKPLDDQSVNHHPSTSVGRTKLQSRQSSLIWRICGCVNKIEQLCPTLELQSILPGTIWWLLFS